MWDQARYLEAFDIVLRTCDEYGKPAGMFCNRDNISWAIERGFRFNTVGDVDGFLRYGARTALENMCH